MLRTISAISVLAVALAGTANAETLFRGTIKFTKKSAACDSAVRVGDAQHSQFHPSTAMLAGNFNFAAINLITNFSALSWAIEGGAFTSIFKEVRNKSVAEKARDPSPKTFLRLTSSVPASLNVNTTNVTIKGQIKNPFGRTGQGTCVADFVASYINEFNS